MDSREPKVEVARFYFSTAPQEQIDYVAAGLDRAAIPTRWLEGFRLEVRGEHADGVVALLDEWSATTQLATRPSHRVPTLRRVSVTTASEFGLNDVQEPPEPQATTEVPAEGHSLGTPPATLTPPSSVHDPLHGLVESLERLAALYANGSLSEAEFRIAKAHVLQGRVDLPLDSPSS